MNTNKLQVFVFAMLFVVGAFTGCVGDDDDKKETTTTEDGTTVTTHKIGFLNPITGPLEPDAPGFKWGADEAAKDLNALYADDNVQFEIDELDSGCSGDVAGPAAQTLVDSGVDVSTAVRFIDDRVDGGKYGEEVIRK